MNTDELFAYTSTDTDSMLYYLVLPTASITNIRFQISSIFIPWICYESFSEFYLLAN